MLEQTPPPILKQQGRSSGCLPAILFSQSALLTICAIFYFIGAEYQDTFLLAAIFAFLFGVFQFVLGLVQFVRFQRFILGLYIFLASSYVASFWFGILDAIESDLGSYVFVIPPIGLSWLLTYINFYETPKGVKVTNEQLEDILDA